MSKDTITIDGITLVKLFDRDRPRGGSGCDGCIADDEGFVQPRVDCRKIPYGCSGGRIYSDSYIWVEQQ